MVRKILMFLVLSPRGFTYGGEIVTLALHTFYRATLSRFYKTLVS